MAYLSEEDIKKIGFKFVGVGVKISDRAAIYDSSEIELGDYSRIDDFCIISGRVKIGKYCHVTPQCLIAGGEPGVYIGDFCTFAYGVKVFAQSDDYSGKSMVNSLIPKKFKNEFFAPVHIDCHVIIGSCSVIFPGVHVLEGCAIGAMSLVNKNLESWGIYVGTPVRRLKERSRNLLKLENEFLGVLK